MAKKKPAKTEEFTQEEVEQLIISGLKVRRPDLKTQKITFKIEGDDSYEGPYLDKIIVTFES